MTLKSDIVSKLREIVSPNCIRVSPEDAYVYSFEKIFEDRTNPKPMIIVKTTAESAIKQIEELADAEGFTLVRRGGNVDLDKIGKANRKVLVLDTTPPPDIAEFDKRRRKSTEEIHETRQKLLNLMRTRERSYKNLTAIIETLLKDEMISHCASCNVCTGYCTVAPNFDHVETWSAKGRYLLTRGFAQGEVQPSKRLADILYSCTLCGSCYMQCIPASQIHEAILDVRGKIAEAGLAPESVQVASRNIRECGNPLEASASQRTAWVKRLPPDSLSEKADVLYWVGCNTALRSGIRKTAVATVNVLNGANVQVMTLGEKEGCCGVPMIFGGLFKEAERNAERVIDMIDEANVETLVTSCSGCYETFVNFYPNKLDIELPCEVLHTSQLLERLMRDERIVPPRLKIRVSYHDPCGLGRHCGVYEAPRNVLRAIPDLQLVEPVMKREYSRCCGGGGGFWGVNSKASMSLARQRILEDIAPLNVDALTTTCPLCYTNFLYTSTKHSLGMNVYDIVEILDTALKVGNS
jgi:Fe-S oxidoreductase